VEKQEMQGLTAQTVSKPSYLGWVR